VRKGVVDRFENEGTIVVVELEYKTTLAIPRSLFPQEVHVNDVVDQTESGLWQVDKEATGDRLKTIQQLMDELWEKEDRNDQKQ